MLQLWVSGITAVLLLFASPAGAAEETSAAEPQTAQPRAPAAAETEFDAEASRKTEQARRINRARKEHETRRAETAAKLEAEQAQEKEIGELHGSVSRSSRRGSYLDHERYWTRREYDSISRDPADLSAMARRGALEREMRDIGSELGAVNASRDAAVRRLDTLRLR